MDECAFILSFQMSFRLSTTLNRTIIVAVWCKNVMTFKRDRMKHLRCVPLLKRVHYSTWETISPSSTQTARQRVSSQSGERMWCVWERRAWEGRRVYRGTFSAPLSFPQLGSSCCLSAVLLWFILEHVIRMSLLWYTKYVHNKVAVH